ncbi:DUF5317 domain-containing protein [Meiothermus sp. QL-1]|uniref:DUF5317 domain-containing protein n=1 Tax=Meiothermus sp. QL-1 TaxID=2058095 RepID=UPI001F3B4D99|nr:DUF5317 domain-containing protein [Meiothermus sp. QL-1]
MGTARGLFPPELAGPLAKALVVGLVGFGLWHNRHLWGLWPAALGLASNALVIFANGGHMPVDPVALHEAGLEARIPKLESRYDAVHTLMDGSSRLGFLADTIPVRLLGYANVISPGDVLLMLGIALTILGGALQARAKGL